MALPAIPVMDSKNMNIGKFEDLEKTIGMFKGLGDILTKKDNRQLEALEKLRDDTKEFVEREKAIFEMFEKNLFSPEQMKAARAKNKVYLEEQKRDKKKFWPKMLEYTKGMAGSLKKMAGNWFLKIIGFLMAMAIFDPNGKMLTGILKFFMGILVWLVKIIAKMLPKVIKTMINLIVEVLPQVIRTLVTSIFPEIGKALKTMGDNFIKEGFPILGTIIKWMSEAFGKDGALYNLGLMFAKIAPVLLSLFLIIGVIVKLSGPLKFIFSIGKLLFVGLQMLWAGLSSLIPVIWSFLAPLLPIILAVGAVVAVFVLLYKYSDKVVGFFESIGAWFMGLGTKFKVLIAVLMAPLLPIIALIYGLAKFFQSVKKNGLKKTLKMIGKWLVSIKNIVWKKIKDIFGSVVNAIFAPFKPIVKIFEKLGTYFGKIFKPLFSTLDKIWDLISGTILSTINWVSNAFSKIGDMFSAIAHYGFYDYFKKASPIERRAMDASATYARLEGTTLKEIADKSTKAGRSVDKYLMNRGIDVNDGSIKVNKAGEKYGVRAVENKINTITKINRVENNPFGKKGKGKR